MRSATVTPYETGGLLIEAHKAIEDGTLEVLDYAVLSSMVNRFRQRGSAMLAVTQAFLAKKHRKGRTTIGRSIDRIVAAGFCIAYPQRAKRVPGVGGWIWRQMPTVYELVIPAKCRKSRESTHAPQHKKIGNLSSLSILPAPLVAERGAVDCGDNSRRRVWREWMAALR